MLPSASRAASSHGNRFPLALRYVDLKTGVSDRLLDFCEDFSEATEDVRDCCSLVQIQPRLCSFIYIFGRQYTVNLSKFHLVHKLLTNENENILPAKCSHIVPDTVTKGCNLLTCDTSFHNESFGYLSVSSKHAKALNEIFDFTDRRMPQTRFHKMTIIAGHRKDVKMLACRENCYFLKCETRRMSFSNLEMH